MQEYVQEHYDSNEVKISASIGLTSSDYFKWVEKINKNAIDGDEKWRRSLVYLCFDNDRLIGLLSIRYELPDDLVWDFGHIGYGVRPSERRKGYATTMLGYALSICKEKGMNSAIISCYKENIASAATIKKSGGVLVDENDNYNEGKISQYYLVNL